MPKTFFVVPGFRMQCDHPMYAWLLRFLRGKRFRVVPVPVMWNHHTLTENAEEFAAFFQRKKGKENHVLGFSYGAVITFLTAQRLQPDHAYLCSLSPDFREDRAHMGAYGQRYIGKRRFADAATRVAVPLAKDLTVPTTVLYGGREGKKYPRLKKRCEDTAAYAKRATLVVAKDAPHDIAHPAYQAAIRAAINAVR